MLNCSWQDKISQDKMTLQTCPQKDTVLKKY